MIQVVLRHLLVCMYLSLAMYVINTGPRRSRSFTFQIKMPTDMVGRNFCLKYVHFTAFKIQFDLFSFHDPFPLFHSLSLVRLFKNKIIYHLLKSFLCLLISLQHLYQQYAMNSFDWFVLIRGGEKYDFELLGTSICNNRIILEPPRSECRP